MNKIFSITFLLLTPILSFANFDTDLWLNPNNVVFSTNDIAVNQKLRVYATVVNNSDKDLSWYVRFFDEKLKKQIWWNEEISIIAWKNDDVFVDWVITWYWNHPISVRVIPQLSSWDDPANNKVTKNIFVDFDSDWDWLVDRKDQDDDNDWIKDNVDSFPTNSRESNDNDKDWIWDNADPDDDNDKVIDTNDAFQFDPTEWDDTDWDWIWDNKDEDDDWDWLLDNKEGAIWTNPLKYDTDWDTINDKNDPFPLDMKRWLDTDGDWKSNFDDKDDDNDWVKDEKDLFPLDKTEWLDSDSDWIWDNWDNDDDNDWLHDDTEISIWTDPLNHDTDWDLSNDKDDTFPLDPKEWADCDWDWIWNNEDIDDDNDKVLDTKDDFVCNSKEWADCDWDWIWNNEDIDDDNDWFNDDVDSFPCDAKEWMDNDKDWVWDNKDQFDKNKAPFPIISYDRDLKLKSWVEILFSSEWSVDEDWIIKEYKWLINWSEIQWTVAQYIFKKSWTYDVTLELTDDVWQKNTATEVMFIESNIFNVYSVSLWLVATIIFAKFLIGLYTAWNPFFRKKL